MRLPGQEERRVKFDPTKTLAELVKLWERGSLLLWALAVGAFVCFLVLVVGAQISAPFVDANKIASPWLLLASIIFATFAGLKQYQERTVQTVQLVPSETQSFYGVVKQSDGTVTTQIAVRMDVFNISEKSIWLPGLKLLHPKSHAPVLQKAVFVQHQSSHLYGPYELPAGARTPGSADFMIQAELGDQIARRGVRLCIEDQFGHRHIINLPNIRKVASGR